MFPFRIFRLTRAVVFGAVTLITSLAECSPQAAAAQASAQSTTTQDANTAARKKRFEEDRRRLENGEATDQGTTGYPPVTDRSDSTLLISPTRVILTVGESQRFCVFDSEGRILTGSAQWSVDQPGVAALTTQPTPEVTALAMGKVKLRAKLPEGIAETEIAVVSAIPYGSMRWVAPPMPGYTNKNLVPAIPSANGPDLYSTEVNGDGDSMIRAFTSDGLLLWVRKVKGPISSLVPGLHGPIIATPNKSRP